MGVMEGEFMEGVVEGGAGSCTYVFVCMYLPMQVLKVGAMASAGMQSIDVEGSVASFISGGKAGFSIIWTCGGEEEGWLN